MDYRKFNDTIVVRIDPGEEIIEQLMNVVVKEDIKLAMVNALGAIKEFTIGAYSVPEQKYYSMEYTGSWEVVSLHGNVTRNNGEPYIHLHLGAGSHTGEMVGGHLNRAVIGGTCEMFITLIDGEIEREKDTNTGLNVFSFK